MGNMQQDIANALIESSKILAQKTMEEAPYTRTIKCSVIGIENASLNLYKVSYGSNTFNAYANSGVSYRENDIVYVLIPEGDLSQPKQIIGAVTPRATMYVDDNEEDTYVPLSENLLNTERKISLASWMDSTLPVSIDINPSIFSGYLEDKKTIKFSAKIRTEIDKDHQNKGNYGLILNLPFLEPAEGGETNQVFKTYTMDVTTMEGNPYSFDVWNKVDLYYTIDSSLIYDNKTLPTLTAFVNGFDYLSPREDIPADIYIQDISLEIVDVLTEEEKSGYYLALVPTKGRYFLSGGSEDTKKTLNPVLKIKGKTESNLSKWECYWFVEDSSIDATSDDFLNFGGLGWKCLNRKTNNGQGFQYVINDYKLTVKQSDVTSTLRYKCVMVQNDVVVNGIIKITNLQSRIKIALVSATGSNKFVANTGEVRLIARIYDEDITTKDPMKPIEGGSAASNDAEGTVAAPAYSLSTAWQRFDKKNNYLDNDFYEVVRYNDPVVIYSVTGESTQWWETEIKFPCSKVDDINTIHCSFYKNKSFKGEFTTSNLGTESIVITTADDFTYGIVIDGGDVLYKYDADGDSPLVANYDGPLSSRVQSIQPLSFRVFKADGSELTESEYLYCHYTWKFPKNSMLELKGENTETFPQDDDYYIITGYGLKQINYTIANVYNKKKSNNTILLSAEFDGNTLNASVSPKFLKDGESGTNGTKYSAIVTYKDYGYGERDKNGKIRKLQFVYLNGIGWKTYDIEQNKLIDFNNPLFNVAVYSDGNLMDSGYSVSWELFDASSVENDYTNINKTCFDLNENQLIIKEGWTKINEIYTNVIRAKVTIQESGNKDVLYAYYPIEITWWNPPENWDAETVVVPTLNGGFDSVLYASDGTNPEYDSSTNFVCDDNLTENIDYTYTWGASDNLKIYDSKTSTKSKKITPTTKFENGDSKNYIKVTFGLSEEKQKDIKAAKVAAETEKAEAEANKIYYTNNSKYLYGTESKPESYIYLGRNEAGELKYRFDYDAFVDQLAEDKVKSLLYDREQSIIIVENMKKILEDMNQYCVDNKISSEIFDYITIYVKRQKKLVKAEKELYKLINEGKLDNLVDIKTEAGSFLSLVNDKVKKYKMSVYNQLRNYAIDYDNQITKYNSYYDKLVAKASGVYRRVTEVAQLQNFTSTLNKAILDNTYLKELTKNEEGKTPPLEEFVNLKSQLTAIIHDLKLVPNEKVNVGIYVSYDTLIKDLLIPIKNLLSIYQDVKLQKVNFKKYISTIENQIVALNEKIDSYNKALANSNKLVHIKPIVMTFNRYEMSNINGWDGNKLYIDEKNNEYLLAPQIGAGEKNANNQFTGMVMGVKQLNKSQSGTINKEIGLFGYHKGRRSIFLDAEKGSATFGKTGEGQIIIDPSATDTAVIRSGDYKWSKEGGKGLEIIFSSGTNGDGTLRAPRIRFGSQKFYVNPDGSMYATSGEIGGWEIGESQLKGGDTILNSNGTITCVNLIAQTEGNIGGWKIGPNTLSTADDKSIVLNGNTGMISLGGTGSSNVKLTSSGLSGENFSLTTSGLSLTGGSISFGGVTLDPIGEQGSGGFTFTAANTKVGNTLFNTHIDNICANYIKTEFLTADVTFSKTISCSSINCTGSDGSTFKKLTSNEIVSGGHSWTGGVAKIDVTYSTGSTGTITVLVADD